mmetsp:Transcript_9147/g.22936  ORF Transcript_9147/g.22936 Transcript_9147/m.22936 type:complete len:479 (+) Transcript_9147:224-1660(+)
MSSGRKVHTSAVCLIPPESVWGQIQRIRAEHDPAYARWMPHINLMYPFVPEDEFSSSVRQLEEALASFQSFKLDLAQFSYFAHGKKSATLFLEPTEHTTGSLKALNTTIESVFPYCNDLSSRSVDGFHAHLTVGKFPGVRPVEAAAAKFANTWRSIPWQVDSVHVISRRGSDPFEIRHTIRLHDAHSSATTDARRWGDSSQEDSAQWNAASSSSDWGLSSEPAASSSSEAERSSFLSGYEVSKYPSVLDGRQPFQFGSQRVPQRDLKASPNAAGAPSSNFWETLGQEQSSSSTAAGRSVAEAKPPLPDGDLGVVVRKVDKWLRKTLRNPRANLPRKRRALESAIRPLCRTQITLLEEGQTLEQVVAQLEARRLIRIDAQQKVHYLRKRDPNQVERPRMTVDAYSAVPSRDQPSAYEVCADWVCTPLNTPTRRETLLTSLQQLVTRREALSTEEVLLHLEKQQWIKVDLHTDKITYLIE